jgi:hypothetical protein
MEIIKETNEGNIKIKIYRGKSKPVKSPVEEEKVYSGESKPVESKLVESIVEEGVDLNK